MKMINKYLTYLGFEVISTYSEYNFDKTNHSIVKIRNDTHMLKPDTPFILSIDSDMKILNENYCIELLNALNTMIQNPSIGVIGLEVDKYHWPFNPPKNYDSQIILTNMTEHVFSTGAGLLLRNIPEWSGHLVPGWLSTRIGGHQDTLSVFERYVMGYRVCCKKINSASVLLDYLHNRGRKVYGWADTSDDPFSIDSYLSIFTIEKYNDLFKKEVYPLADYWTNPQQLPYIQSLQELKEEINYAFM
jgi:hypothetical protein